MSGIKKPDCFSGIKETEFYYKEINPYELPPKSNFNIGALSEYLTKTGKNIYSLTKDEAEQFVLA